MTSAAPPSEASIWGKGPPEGTGFVQNGIEDVAGRVRNPAHLFRVEEGIGKTGLVPVKVERQRAVRRFGGWLGCWLRLGDVGRGGWRAGDWVPWLLT